jgi:hypothetical protein
MLGHEAGVNDNERPSHLTIEVPKPRAQDGEGASAGVGAFQDVDLDTPNRWGEGNEHLIDIAQQWHNATTTDDDFELGPGPDEQMQPHDAATPYEEEVKHAQPTTDEPYDMPGENASSTTAEDTVDHSLEISNALDFLWTLC